jgi:striatin 1/3/4
MERSQWEVERAELQARIAFLQGERKGQENLKQDLVRRIKMLEHALKQERAKLHKLKYGVDLNDSELKPPAFDSPTEEIENHDRNNSNLSWRQGRKLLRQYLEEIGYTDTIIDVRSQRVRSFLGLQGRENDNEQMNSVTAGDLVNGDSNGPQGVQGVKREGPVGGTRQPGGVSGQGKAATVS